MDNYGKYFTIVDICLINSIQCVVISNNNQKSTNVLLKYFSHTNYDTPTVLQLKTANLGDDLNFYQH